MATFLSGLVKALFRGKPKDYGVPEFLPWHDGNARTLVVFAHEWGTSGASRWRIKRVLWGQSADSAELPQAEEEAILAPHTAQAPLGPVDLMAPIYVENPLSNLSPKRAAFDMQKAIHQQVEKRLKEGDPYDSVVLVGYSSGSLVLRKAMVWGLGQLEDHPDAELAAQYHWRWALNEDGKNLNDTIKRVVLIAGVNRGWSLTSRPKDMGLGPFIVYRGLDVVARAGLIGQFILSLERGEPFVADLRLQWLRLAQRLNGLPPAFQLLGTIDDIVHRDDNKDVLALGNASVLLVEDADHNGILRLHDPVNGQRFRLRLVRALRGEVDDADRAVTRDHRRHGEAQLEASTLTAKGSLEEEISMIVLPVHGIRANHDWCNRFRSLLLASLRGGRIYCPCESYGHFSILRFLLLPTRRRMVRWFVDLYTESVAAVGRTDVPVHFVGHSNGTYLLARALLDYHTIDVDRVVLTGSVVQRSFPWRTLHEQGRIGHLRNERAARDLIVGVFPGF